MTSIDLHGIDPDEIIDTQLRAPERSAPRMLYQHRVGAALTGCKPSTREFKMSRSKRTLGMWCTMAAASVAVVGAVAPAAHATPPRPAAPVTTAVAKTCSDWVELKWPNGTGTGVWVRDCS